MDEMVVIDSAAVTVSVIVGYQLPLPTLVSSGETVSVNAKAIVNA
jgi:hypothetical protein